LRENSILRLELSGHQSLVVGASVAMFIAGFASTFLGLPAHDIVASSTVGTAGELDSSLAVVIAVLPAVFSPLGVYAIVEAAQSMMRYEAGVYSSQGVERSRLLRAWMLLLGVAPLAAFLLGAGADIAFTPSFVVSVEVLLPIVVSAPLVLAVTAYKITAALNESAYGTMRS
jgi:hypothetical protein